jgi:hypothetical protein
MLEAYRPGGLVRTSVQALENERPGSKVVAAVNADFFSFETGRPIGNQVRNEMIVAGTKSARSHLGITENFRPFIEVLSFQGEALWDKGTVRIDGVNQKRGVRKSVLYNSYWGRELKSDSNGIRINLRLIDGWGIADTLRAVVVNHGEDPLTFDDLSAAALVLEGGVLKGEMPDARDTLKLFLAFERDRRPYSQVLGGGGRILKDGTIVGDGTKDQEGIRSKFFTDRHPRTFVGFDRDTTAIFLCTVDGRQASSIGMNFKEMGEFLLEIGVWNAVNLDGGGSTTMVVRHNVVNSPSDASGERPVANTLQLLENTSEERGHEN